ncbi:MAG: 4'-phosphopantetheinyl transferase superfamily protein [Spirochaetales bacterium]|nr:4'-phosphopantetheinyl transferase superfamily protein [Spirochaetales bacterium]
MNSLHPHPEIPGNDVVDLRACRDTFRPRFVERVFAPEEQEQLRLAVDATVLGWLFWAAKEAAYKVLSRLDRGLPFRWKLFVARIAEPEIPLPAWLKGQLIHPAGSLNLEMELTAEYVHVRAGQKEVPPGRVALLPPGKDESVAVREMALEIFAGRYGMSGRIEKRDGLPVIYSGDLCVPVSLSHHGRFIAVAFF